VEKYRIMMLIMATMFFVCDFTNAEDIYTAQVTKVIDGDSIVVSTETGSIQLRLWGIDTPEYRQPFSKAAKKFTQKLLQDQTVDLIVKDFDKYGRVVAMIRMTNGEYANELLIKSGFAWVHIYYCKEPICEKWRKFQTTASEKKLGLWREPNPVAPWIWKKKHKRR